MKLIKCALYLAGCGVFGFLFGRLLSKFPFRGKKGIFRCFAFEKGGTIYEKLKIRKWQARVPDMSKILPFLMPSKNLKGNFDQRLPTMIRETCVAELTHIVVSFLGLPCLWLWPGIGGAVITLFFILFLNLPFILIQRYNRPRLLRLMNKRMLRKKKEGTVCAC